MANTIFKALSYWFYVTLLISLLTLFFSFLKPTSNPSFLTFPNNLQNHYFSGKFIKLQNCQIFAVEQNPDAETEPEHVFLLHGLACSSFSFRQVLELLKSRGLHAIAIDLPGSGFSDRFHELFENNKKGGFLSVFYEIKEKGVFWAFDQLVETGEMPNGEKESKSSVKDGIFMTQIMGDVVGEVFDVMLEGKPFHLVVHDSAWGAVVDWVTRNPNLVKSITFIDSSPSEFPAFPFWVLEKPVFGDLILKSKTVFGWFVKLCCLRLESGKDVVEAYRVLMNERGLKGGVVGFGNGLNYSFDLGEWVRLDGVKELKFQVIWSNTWSDRWIDEGRRIGNAVPDARFNWHSGGRWPQEDAPEEIASMISQFVLSLPKSVAQTNQEYTERRNIKVGENSHSHHHYSHGNNDENVAHLYGMHGLQEWGNGGQIIL